MNHPFELFDIPALASTRIPPITAGGIGAGSLKVGPAGEFHGWRMNPGVPEDDHPVSADRFYVWTRSGTHVTSRPLTGAEPSQLQTSRLFPFTWTRYPGALPLALESLASSPLLPSTGGERSLPLHVIAFRASNPTPDPIEAALMLTWRCGWPAPVEDAVFDFQHDNLCLTGSLGSPDSPNRQGIAIPDLHYVGIYQQGIEPWAAPVEESEVVEDFSEDGELDPRIARGAGQGAAAWVKFDLEPGETKEIPFVLVWHFPTYETGPLAGEPRYYTQFLGRRRPDNAIVWLAEQAVQHYGTEVAQYRHWQQAIEDWQAAVLAGEDALDAVDRTRFESFAALLEADAAWAEDGRIVLAGRVPIDREVLRRHVEDIWPDIARQI